MYMLYVELNLVVQEKYKYKLVTKDSDIHIFFLMFLLRKPWTIDNTSFEKYF